MENERRKYNMRRAGTALPGVFLVLLFFCFSCTSDSVRVACSQVDSLNSLAYQWRYKNLDSSLAYAEKAEQTARICGKGLSAALLHKAYVAYFRMDYHQAEVLVKQACGVTQNQIDLLRADVLMMRVCQRSSRNYLFYTYRNKALKTISRIREELKDLSSGESLRFTYAVVEFHLVSAFYYYNMELQESAAKELEQVHEEDIENNIPLYLEYMYLLGYTGMNVGVESREILLEKFDVLFKAFATSRYYGMNYLEAYSCWSISLIFINTHYREVLREERPGWYDYLYTQYMGWYDPSVEDNNRLAIYFAQRSLELLLRYDYKFMIVTLYQTLGFFHIVNKDYIQAEVNLRRAMDLINDYHKQYYIQKDRTPLEMYKPGMTNPQDQKWLLDENMYTVPEWIARQREHLSVLYTVLGNYDAVAYNRNTYLKTLEAIRHDKAVENKFQQMTEQTKSLRNTLIFVLLFVPLFLVAFLIFFRIWNMRSRRQSQALRKTLELCDRLTDDWLQCHNLPEQTGWRRDEKQLMWSIMQPFVNWTKNTAEKLRNLDEEYQTLCEEQRVCEYHIYLNKRKNIGKRAKMYLLYSIFPMISRLQHEIQKYGEMKNKDAACLDYALELTEQISQYNEILSRWIIMNRGDLNLHIETFRLSELFSLLVKNNYSFLRKGIILKVAGTDLCVKADKALTLFMISTLMDNARKFTAAGGSVSVGVSEGESYVEIYVSDTGEGMTHEEIQTILGNKVYDSSLIGKGRQDLRKGQGFGLMNCKGIIEKYRKTNPIFQVCSFCIESEPGKGSRFSFRLPKGRCRVLMLLFFLCFSTFCNAQNTYQSHENMRRAYVRDAGVDDDLKQAVYWADSLYFANIAQNYADAMACSDSAFSYINRYHKKNFPESSDMLFSGKPDFLTIPVEVKWCQKRIPMDYSLLLDLRNETAIAAMNLHDWSRYYYNNRVYTLLYKNLGQDEELAAQCVMMEQTQNNMRMNIVWLVFASVIALLAFYILYFRKRIAMQWNLEQITDLNNILFEHFPEIRQEELEEKLQDILKLLWSGFNEIHPVSGISVMLLRNDHSVSLQASQGNLPEGFLIPELMNRVVQTTTPIRLMSGYCVYPLAVNQQNNEKKVFGALLLYVGQNTVQESDLLLDELIVRSLSIFFYQKIVVVNQEYENIDLARDELERIRYEEDALYVQNQILDNCLSAIKHETMYYPSRIHQVIKRMRAGISPDEEQEELAGLKELVVYYRSVFGILFAQAKRQLGAVSFRRRDIETEHLAEQMRVLFERMKSKRQLQCSLQTETYSCLIRGDETMLLYLLENLLRGAFERTEQLNQAVFSLNIVSDGDFVRFSFHDSRKIYVEENVANLFQPEGGGIPYLICRQIIREHDTYLNFCGCRIIAEREPGGSLHIWFTIPKKK